MTVYSIHGWCSRAVFWLNLVAGGIPCWPPFHRLSRACMLHRHLKLNINVKNVALDIGSGWWSRAVISPWLCTWWRGVLLAPPFHWLGGLSGTLPFAHVAWHYLAWRDFIPMITAISKLNFKRSILNFKDNFLDLCLRTQLAMSISLQG
jgi:hypothetical protein